MKKTKIKKYAIAAMTALFVLMLTGCQELYLHNESSGQREQYEKNGERIITEYLETNIPDAEVLSCYCNTVYEGDYSYITDYVQGNFSVGAEEYYYYVNVDSGDVYTTYYADEIGRRVCSRIMDRLGIENYVIGNSSVTKKVKTTENEQLDSDEFDKTLNIYIPGNINQDNLDEFIAEVLSGNGYFFDVTIRYDDDVRIEDLDFNQLNDEYEDVALMLYHMQSGSDIKQSSVLEREEALSIVFNAEYCYTSYNRIEKDDIFLLYKEYSCEGKEYVDISLDDVVKADNFSINIDGEKIDIVLKEDVEYYLCFYDLDFLNGNDLYYYLSTAGQYEKAGIAQDAGYYYSSVYYGGARPVYQSETFYIGDPSAE